MYKLWNSFGCESGVGCYFTHKTLNNSGCLGCFFWCSLQQLGGLWPVKTCELSLLIWTCQTEQDFGSSSHFELHASRHGQHQCNCCFSLPPACFFPGSVTWGRNADWREKLCIYVQVLSAWWDWCLQLMRYVFPAAMRMGELPPQVEGFARSFFRLFGLKVSLLCDLFSLWRISLLPHRISRRETALRFALVHMSRVLAQCKVSCQPSTYRTNLCLSITDTWRRCIDVYLSGLITRGWEFIWIVLRWFQGKDT